MIEEAIEKVTERSFDVILTDIEMPGGNGIEVLEATKRIRPDTPVFVMTGRISEFLDQKRLSRAEGLFEKPFDFKTLIKALGKACCIRRTSVPLAAGPRRFSK